MEWLIDLLKYITQPANVNAHSLDIIIDMNIPRTVKEGSRTQRGSNPGPNVHVLGLHQEIPQVDGWKSFLSNDDNKNNLI